MQPPIIRCPPGCDPKRPNLYVDDGVGGHRPAVWHEEQDLAFADVECEVTPQRVRSMRHLRGLFMVQVARLAGIPTARIGQFERGETRPLRSEVGRLSAALNVPMAFFWLPALAPLKGPVHICDTTRPEREEHRRALRGRIDDPHHPDAWLPVEAMQPVAQRPA